MDVKNIVYCILLIHLCFLFNPQFAYSDNSACVFKEEDTTGVSGDFKKFLQAGGNGVVISYSGNFEGINGTHSFLLIKKFPDANLNSPSFTFLRNKKNVQEMQKLVDDGVAILLIEHKDYPNLKAMVMPHWVSLPKNLKSCKLSSTDQPTVIITAGVHDYAYIHEMQHFRDYNAINSSLEDDLNTAYQGADLSQAEKLQVKLFILEQRAYVKQIQAFRIDRYTRDHFYYFTSKGNIKTLDADTFALMQRENDFWSYTRYYLLLSFLLDRIKENSPSAYAKIKEVIDDFSLDDSQFGLDVVLPQHFE